MRRLAVATTCRRCGREVYAAYCSDGRWRLFEHDDFPPGDMPVWAWRKHQGMQEQELVAGKVLHHCPRHHEPLPDEWTKPGWMGEYSIDVAAVLANELAGGHPVDVVDPGGDGWTWVCAGCGRIARGEPARRQGNAWYCPTCDTP